MFNIHKSMSSSLLNLLEEAVTEGLCTVLCVRVEKGYLITEKNCVLKSNFCIKSHYDMLLLEIYHADNQENTKAVVIDSAPENMSD